MPHLIYRQRADIPQEVNQMGRNVLSVVAPGEGAPRLGRQPELSVF